MTDEFAEAYEIDNIPGVGKRKDADKKKQADIELSGLANFRLFDAGETLFTEGHRGSEAYVVKTGRVRITRGDGKTAVGEAGPGDIVGEMAVISDAPRLGTATAVEETLCVALSRRAVQIMIARTDFETRTLIDFLITQVQQHISGEAVDKDELRRNHRILELLMESDEQMAKLKSMEPFFALLCESLLKRAQKAMA